MASSCSPGGVEETMRPHALVVPALPPSHTSVCMRLARALSAVGFHVTFVCFSSRLPPGREPTVVDAQNTSSSSAPYTLIGTDNGITTYVVEDDIPPHKLGIPFLVTPSMQDNLLNLILAFQDQGSPPTCLVSDSFLPWTLPIAQRVSIPRIEFWPSNALSYLLVLNTPALCRTNTFPERVTTDAKAGPVWKSGNPLMLDCIPCLPPISSELYPPQVRFDEEPSPFRALFNEMCSCGNLADRVLLHSISELEPDAFRGLQAMGVSGYGISGTLLHQSFESKEDKQQHCNSAEATQTEEEQRADCLSWLDMQEEASVIYVAFGTVTALSVEDIQELAMGLEACGSPFLWVIRDDSHGGDETPQAGLLEGLVERTHGKGMVISWAPQVKVLAHKAIAGFLTHCGWNSTLESLWMGVPMLCCPQFGDQRACMWLICELWGTGLELKRTDNGGLHRAHVESGMKALLQREARKRAQEYMHLVRKACQEGCESFNNLHKLYDDMKAIGS